MNKFLTEENPAKVTSLLAVSIASMFFLFAVSVTNANFSKTESPFPSTFNPDKVVALLDTSSNSYAYFFHNFLVAPGEQSYAILQYNINATMDDATPGILAYTGLSSLAQQAPSPQAIIPRVAGDSTYAGR